MEIRVYDSDLRLLGIIENQTSLLWTRRYYEPGEFEITAPNTPSNRKLLVIDNLVSKKNDDDAGVIEYIQMSEGTEDNTIVARGKFLSSYLDRRITKATKLYRGLIEDIINQMIYYGGEGAVFKEQIKINLSSEESYIVNTEFINDFDNDDFNNAYYKISL